MNAQIWPHPSLLVRANAYRWTAYRSAEVSPTIKRRDNPEHGEGLGLALKTMSRTRPTRPLKPILAVALVGPRTGATHRSQLV